MSDSLPPLPEPPPEAFMDEPEGPPADLFDPPEPGPTRAWKRPPIVDQVPLTRHAVIEASAGTGKTYTIEHLVVDRLLRGVPLPEILVVTFTEKATAELRARVRRLIEQVLTAPVVDPADPPDPATHWVFDDAGRARLDDALYGFDRASIFTIHGFCHRVLAELAFDSGQLFDQDIIDSTRAFNRAFREALRTRLATVPAHKALLDRWLGEGHDVPALERLLRNAHRQRYPVGGPSVDEEIVSLLDQLTAELDVGAVVTDYAGTAITRPALAAAEKALRTLAAALEHGEGPADRLAAALRVDRKAILHPRRTAPHGKRHFPDGLGEQAARTRDALARLEVLDALRDSVDRAAVDAFLPEVVARVERNKRRDGQLDYDDLLDRVWQGLDGPQGPGLVQALRARFRVAFIDEFQDTDDRQWDIFHRVFVQGTQAHALAIIGDPKQAIYGFRGADVHTYLVARSELLRIGAARVPLDTNFRSSPECIDAVNHLLDQAAAHPLFTGEIRYDEPVKAGQPGWALTNAAGEPVAPVCLWQYRPPPPRGSRHRDRVPKYLLQDAFARALARSLRDLFADDAGLWVADPALKGERRRLTPKDVFVLVRGRWDAVDAARALREAGVPHAFYKQEGLFQSVEAHDLRDVLAAVVDPQKRSARLKAFATPIFGVPWRELDRYRGLAAGHPLVERLHAWRQLGEAERYPELFHQILHGSGLVERELFLRTDDRALVNYQHILEMLLQAATGRRLALPEVVDLLQRYIDRAEQPEGSDGNVQRLTGVDDAVQIMTVHKSKGLEAPVVCLFGGFAAAPTGPVNVVHDHLEGRRVLVGDAARETAAEQLDREHREEDERLLYVALTRARSRLYLPFLESTRGVPGTFFEPLKDRLMHLHKAGDLPARLFHAVAVDARYAPKAPQHPAAEPVAAWLPPAALLNGPDPAQAPFAGLRERHAPLLVTSYTRMKAEAEARAATLAEAPIEADEFHADAGASEAPAPDPEALPGGREVGRFLHEAIEGLDLATAFRDRRFEAFRDDPAVIEVFDTTLRRHGIDRRWRAEAQRLIWATLTTPIPLPDGGLLRALWRPRHVVEMEFLFPLPEPGHALLGDPAGQGFAVERGYVKGFIDYLFEHEGRVYVLDWKSDNLADFSPAVVDRHVADHYALQAQLYTVGVVRWLGITDEADFEARFGGLLYVFLRGVGAQGAGVWGHRPDWATVQAWERSFLPGAEPVDAGFGGAEVPDLTDFSLLD